jgi:hypothetical protein
MSNWRVNYWLHVILPVVTSQLLSAQTQWQMQGGRMQAVVVTKSTAQNGGKEIRSLVESGMQLAIPSGDNSIHFASNEHGKPASIRFTTPNGSWANVGIASGGPVINTRLLLVNALANAVPQGAVLSQLGDEIQLLTETQAEHDLSSYRLSATIEKADGGIAAGIVARYRIDSGCYLFLIDWLSRKLRIERWMGGDHMVIGEVAAPWLKAKHTLTMQVDGFRLAGYVDDEIVIQVFDGAFTAGSAGFMWQGTRPGSSGLRVEPIVQPLSSAAVVQLRHEAWLHASTTALPGCWYMLELALDMPHPFIPKSVGGWESSLMRAAAAPLVLVADWSGTLGRNGIGKVSDAGNISIQLQWPELPALNKQAALARALIVNLDGSVVVGVTPSVAVTL